MRFGELGRGADNRQMFFWQRYSTYCWLIDDGPRHLKRWIDDSEPLRRPEAPATARWMVDLAGTT